MSDIDFVALIEPVARHLWGEPAKGLVTKLSIRWGSNGSKSADLKAGTWYDHEAREGGGVIDLVMREIACDKAGAVEWLEAEGFIQPREKSPQIAQDRRDDSPPMDEPPADDRQPEGAPEAVLVAVKGYHYKDRDGELLYDVIRKQWRLPDGSFVIDPKTGNPKKQFAQRRPDGHGGWIWNLEGVTPTIYLHQHVDVGIAEGKTIYLVEGEKDAETLVEWGLVATTNSGGAKHWTDFMAHHLRGADVVILPDNDDAGREGAEKKALSLRGIASHIRVLDLAAHVPNVPARGDVTDWRDRMGGTAEQLAALIGQLPDWHPAPPVSKFNASHIADVETRRKRRRHSWLVQDLIELGGTCSFSGFSEAGKTFAIIELSFCIARGEKFFGHDVEQGLVIYQVGEGELGFEKRIEGYAQDRGITDRKAIPFIYLPKKINLFVDDKDTDALIEECKGWKAYFNLPLRLLVIDTFNKATRGANEISGQDMGKINDRVERIATELECTVILIDHLNASGGLRGHGSKTADSTNTVKVERTDRVDQNNRKVRKIVFGKNKDGETGTTCAFVLRQVVLEYDDLGRPVTTCVVDTPDGDEEVLVARGRLSLNQSLVLRAIRDTAEIEGEKAPPELVQVPPGRNVAKWPAVMARLRKTWQFTATDPAKREIEITRVVGDAGKRLQLAGFIDRDNERGLIWWTGKEDRPRPEPKPAEKPPALPADVKEALAEGVPF